MPLPRWLARLNRSATNRILGSLPRRLSPFVIVSHVGRVSGRTYSVPLAAFRTEEGVILTPTYGPTADWVKNVLAAGSFRMDQRGETHTYTGVRLVGRAEAWLFLPRPVRIAMRLMRINWFVAADRSGIADGERLNGNLL